MNPSPYRKIRPIRYAMIVLLVIGGLLFFFNSVVASIVVAGVVILFVVWFVWGSRIYFKRDIPAGVK